MKKLLRFAEGRPGLAAVLLVAAACVPLVRAVYGW